MNSISKRNKFFKCFFEDLKELNLIKSRVNIKKQDL